MPAPSTTKALVLKSRPEGLFKVRPSLLAAASLRAAIAQCRPALPCRRRRRPCAVSPGLAVYGLRPKAQRQGVASLVVLQEAFACSWPLPSFALSVSPLRSLVALFSLTLAAADMRETARKCDQRDRERKTHGKKGNMRTATQGH